MKSLLQLSALILGAAGAFASAGACAQDGFPS